MIQSYMQKPVLADRYDAIIIGSGMSGLATGALLSKEGQRVLVLEQHYTAGGFTHVFKRKGYEWDVGIHYIGEVGRETSVMRKLFDYITNGQLQWADIGAVYDRIVIGTEVYDFVKGVGKFKEQILSYFPEEEEAVAAYIDLVFKATKASRGFYMDKALPKVIQKLSMGMLRRSFYKYSDLTTLEVLRKLTDNDQLIKVLTGQYGDYGLPPGQSSFAMHASVVRHYFAGGYFPVGGSAQIVKSIDPVIESGGGTILVRAQVDEVLIEYNRVYGVRMSDDRVIRADRVVSSIGILNTYSKLLPRHIVSQHGLMSPLQSLERSVAHTCLYVGLEGTAEELGLPKANFWIYPDDVDHDRCVERYLDDITAPFPMVYISFPSAKDPDWINRYPGHSTIEIITLLPYDTFRSWEGTKWKKRGKNYEQLKEKIAQRLLKKLYQRLPHLEGKISYHELSTPLTTQHFVNYDKGEIYGLSHTPQRFRQRCLQPRTSIGGFYLTGQDIVTAGVGGALFSGVLTATAMTGTNILKRL